MERFAQEHIAQASYKGTYRLEITCVHSHLFTTTTTHSANMGGSDVITISIAKELRVPGQEVSGIVDVNVELAKERGVEEMTLSLRGEVNAYVCVHRPIRHQILPLICLFYTL